MNDLKSKYNDISFTACDAEKAEHFFMTNDADIKHDYFLLNTGNKAIVFSIIKNQENIGFISLYNIDNINRNAYIYGFTKEKMYYSDLIKSIISLMMYAFESLKLNKLNFVYREDNYFFDYVCKHLKFINEGRLRKQFYYDSNYYNLCTYSLLQYEFKRLIVDDYKKIYTWDYNFTPENFTQIDITRLMNNRAFSNDLNNTNGAHLNDFNEFVLNKKIEAENCLTYKNIKFHVNIFDLSKENDNIACQNQEIFVTEDFYNYLLIVVMAQFGHQKSTITLVYEDGSSETQDFYINDWCERILNDEYIIYYALGCRYLQQNISIIKGDSFILLKKISVNFHKKLKKIILPNNKNINIFALGGNRLI
jgi:RimJ/RimL family protein N-acetyltransferase